MKVRAFFMSIENAVLSFRGWCFDHDIDWPHTATPQFETYLRLLEHAQTRTNLVGFSTPLAIANELFTDCAQILRSRSVHGSVLDVGTGAGFPALVLKILNPDLHMHLVEPRTKRYAFLRQVERELGLKNLRIDRARIEQVSVDPHLTLAISKAFAPLAQWLEMAKPWAQHGAMIACLVSLEDWQQADLSDYTLHFSLIEKSRVYAILKKI